MRQSIPSNGTPQPGDPILSPSTASSMNQTMGEMNVLDKKHTNETLIFKLLAGFNLQQYTKQFIERGISDEIYKLALLSSREKAELYGSMKLLPGHGQRFEDMFDFLMQVYPRENAKQEIVSQTTYGKKMRHLDSDDYR